MTRSTGTYKAWLSTSTVNAIGRLNGASGWVRPDGRPMVNSHPLDLEFDDSQGREAGAAGDSTANSLFNMFGTIVACNATWMSLACLQE